MMRSTKLWKVSAKPLPSLTARIQHSYIKQKDIDEIKSRYPNKSLMDEIKIGLLLVKLLCVQGYRDAKADYKQFKELKLIPPLERTHEQQQEYQRIRTDVFKAIPTFTVLNVPFGGPLFFTYLQIFPNFTPTWLLTERMHHRFINQHRDNRQQACYYFTRKYKSNDAHQLATQIVKNYNQNQSNEQLRMICNVLIGSYQDGTYYLTHASPLRYLGVRFDYFILSGYSKYVLQLKIRDIIKHNPFYPKKYGQLQKFEDKLLFLLEQELTLLIR